MDPMKQSYDILGEKALDRLYTISPPPHSPIPRNPVSNEAKSGLKSHGTAEHPPEGKRDLYLLLRENALSDEALRLLWAQVNTVPSWVCWDQIARGQDCFYRYGGPVLTGLAFQSLLGGMVTSSDSLNRREVAETHLKGAARVVETLARTGGFSTKVARHRETTQHILQCTQSLESIQPGGAGHASSIRVRLLHAAVRQRIMKLARQRPEYYDVGAWGIPINDLDCIATIGTFSATLIWVSLPRQGIFMTQGEIIDYIALWRYIAYLTGTPTEHFETPEKAKRVMEVLLLYEIKPTETSKVLANNIIKSLAGQPPGFASEAFLQVNSRWLNGNELSDALGIGRPSIYYWALAVGQCLFFMAICYTYRAVPYLDRRKIAALRRVFWQVIIKNESGLGEETTFDFKYIPDLSKKTQIEDVLETGVKKAGIEQRNLQALGIGCILFALTACFGLKIVIAVVKRAAKWLP
ncbi:MAG: hypothetical protein ASARMPREDX12_007493 [Alectoria sarmentosa]|nr:MAG: hypothetical protein ASARMPREDX12_007493 [Alectoria sarmentosa]